MKIASITINKNYKIGKVEKTIFSSFVEHMGRCVYGGIYEPENKAANAQGFRTDVIEAISELGVETVRYPGGNFVSGYNWKDGIGPKEQRQPKLNLAWNQIEPNEVGVDEFMNFAKEANCQPIMAVNLGTGDAQSAAELVEYCNSETNTYWANERRKNGAEKAYNVKYWCLGNEMDGEWQICHKSADEYGRLATETAKMMKWVDPSIKLTLCGSSGSEMPSYPEWDRVVLEHAYDYVDYISLHKYYGYPELDETRRADFLASYVDFDKFISAIGSVVDYVRCLKRSNKQVYLSVDEWNVWHKGRCNAEAGKREVSVIREENTYNVLDAAVFSSLICTLVNHADKVKVACLAQLVNVLAPIMVDGDKGIVKQTIFYPFMNASRYCVGEAYDAILSCNTFDSVYGKAKDICACVVQDEEGFVNVLAVSLTGEQTELSFEFEHFGELEITEHTAMFNENEMASNTFENPNRVQMKSVAVTDSKKVVLQPYSVNFIRLKDK